MWLREQGDNLRLLDLELDAAQRMLDRYGLTYDTAIAELRQRGVIDDA